ncbi:MAG: MFS transporter [Cellvibrionaceae bacterium]
MTSFDPAFERRAITSLASLYAFRMLGLFMVLPVLALYGDEYSGSTPLMLGIALGAYGFTQALLQIPFGILSDRWGRKPIIAIGLIIFALGSVVAACADSVYELILGRCLQGGGAIASAIMAMVADLTSDESRTKAMASIGASIGLSFSVALVLGPVLAGWGGISSLFWATVMLALVGLWVLWRWVPTPAVRGRHREAGAVPELLRTTLIHPQLLRLNVGIFALHFVLMACFLVMPSILESQLGFARDQHWLIYLPLLLLAFVAMVPFIIIAEKRRKIKPIFVAAVVLLGAMIAVMAGVTQSRWGFLAALFFFFMAFNLLEATLPSLMSKLAPAGAKGTASGIYSTSQFLGAFAGGVSAGWLLQYESIDAVFALCAALVLIWFLLALTMSTPRFLAGVQVPLQAEYLSQADELLSALPGVVEVVLIKEEITAYLKVDPAIFDRDSIAEIEWSS